MKKIIAVFLVISTVFCIAGCDQELFYSQISSEQNNVASEQNKIVENIKIDSLDKLNYYAVKKAIAEDDIELLNAYSQNSKVTTFQSNRQAEVLNLAKTTASKIDSNSTFTITMYTYFTITLSDAKGFLAQKLGGSGTVEVVITKNNFNNMITFKKGDKYYSCFEISSTNNTMSFSSSKYAMGYYLIENNNTANCEFTVYFEGDRVIGLNCAVSQKIGTNEYALDKIKLNNNFSFVLYKKQSFTPNQLENLFTSNNSFVEDGVVLDDETILFGKALVTNEVVKFKNSSGNCLITNNQIKMVTAMQNSEFGFCIKLDLSSDIALSGKTKVGFYLEDFKVKEVVLQKTSKAVYITNLTSKNQMLDLYNTLTSTNADNRIGNIKSQEDLVREMSKKINFDIYTVTKVSEYVGEYEKYSIYTYKFRKRKTDNYDKSGYQITIDGKNITFPIRVSELLYMGFSVKSTNGDNVLFNTPEGNVLDTMVFDLYGDAKDFKDKSITYVGFSCHKSCCSYHTNVVNTTLPNFEIIKGINKDSTLDEIVSKLGPPEYIMADFSEQPQRDRYDYSIKISYELTAKYCPKLKLTIDINPLLNNGAPSDLIKDITLTFEPIDKNN